MTVTELIQLGGLCVAFYGLRTWRLQLIGKRRFEIAEETVVAAHKAGDDLIWMRHKGRDKDEADDRPRAPDEPERHERRLNSYYIPIKRAQASHDDFAALAKCSLLCSAYFGDAALAPFNVLLTHRDMIVATAETLTLMTSSGGLDKLAPEQVEELESRIWGRGKGALDELAMIRGAVAAIDALCRPALALPDDIAAIKRAAAWLVERVKRGF